jgi:phosphonoacetaldehyde hydrolase
MLLNQDTPRGLGAKRVLAVIFDWAGTTVDFGSLAPVRTLERVFGEAGVPITEDEARRDMGVAKRDHIAALLSMPRVRTEWARVRGREVMASDIDVLYERFMPLQLDCLTEYSRVIAGVPEVVEKLRGNGIKIGSTTGYTRPMLDLLVTEAAREGYRPDCSVSPEEGGSGRPHPFMIYAAAVKMQVWPLGAIVKVGDTESDIKEGLNAGVWSVGVAGTGNAVGLPAAQFGALTAEERARRVQKGRGALEAAGAHYVMDTLADLGGVIEDVEARLSGKSAASV